MDDSLPRRSLLKVAGAIVFSVPFAGCSVRESSPDDIVVGGIVIRNARPEPQALRLELSRDGELVYEGTHTAAASDDVGVVTEVESTWSTDPGVYELTYVVREAESLDVLSETITADDVGSDDECVVPTITLRSTRDDAVDFGVGGSEAGFETHCPATQTTSDRN